MFWLISAIVATLARTGTHILNKRMLKDVGPLTLTASTTLFICTIYSPVFFLSVSQNPVISTNNLAYIVALVSGLLNSLAIILLMKALKFGDMSIAVPLRNLVPLFAMIWAVIFLGEMLGWLLVLSTMMIVIGALLLHIDSGFQLRLRRRGSLFAVSTAIIYSFAIVADKFATTYIEPVKYTFLIYLVMLISLLMFSMLERKLSEISGFIRKSWRPVIVIAILASVGSFFTFTAISLVPVTIIAPIFRLEVLFSVIAGGLFFREKNMLVRLLGAGLLFIGMVLIMV
jgi:drug/metabolite transporter (DMT)-like permease